MHREFSIKPRGPVMTGQDSEGPMPLWLMDWKQCPRQHPFTLVTHGWNRRWGKELIGIFG